MYVAACYVRFDNIHTRVCQGTCVQDNTLNIFLEYVPGGSIASLLAKFGTVVRHASAVAMLDI